MIKSKFRIYDLRHSFATRILESSKVDLLTLASMLGHSSLDRVIRYTHSSEQRKAETIGAIEKRQKQSKTVKIVMDSCIERYSRVF